LGWKPQWGIKTAVEKVIEFAKADTDTMWLSIIEKQIPEYFEHTHV
jgi:hypothetical protein